MVRYVIEWGVLSMSNDKFTWVPEREPVERLIHKVLISEFESGKEQRRKKAPMKREFDLTFIREDSVGEAIWNFYKNKEGPLQSFEWDHPTTEDTLTVRFRDNLERSFFIGTHVGTGQTFEITLVEVL